MIAQLFDVHIFEFFVLSRLINIHPCSEIKLKYTLSIFIRKIKSFKIFNI